MCNRLVDHEKFSAQRCFYHDVAVPINGKPHFPALTGSGCEVALFNEPPPGQIGCSLIIGCAAYSFDVSDHDVVVCWDVRFQLVQKNVLRHFHRANETKNAVPQRHRLNYHGPVTVQPNDVSFGFKIANTPNTNRANGNFERIIDVKCIDLHGAGSVSYVSLGFACSVLKSAAISWNCSSPALRSSTLSGAD